jgi:hypothetical protein
MNISIIEKPSQEINVNTLIQPEDTLENEKLIGKKRHSSRVKVKLLKL